MQQQTSSQTEFNIQNFFQRLNATGKLSGTICKRCGTKWLPPRPICSKCSSSELEWFDLKEQGTLRSFSEIHVSNELFSKFVPYVVALAEFDDGITIPGILRNTSMELLRVGMKVRLETSSDTSKTSEKGFPPYWFELL